MGAQDPAGLLVINGLEMERARILRFRHEFRPVIIDQEPADKTIIPTC